MGTLRGLFIGDCSRLEIVSGLNPREIVSDVVPGSPTKCVGGYVGGNLVSGGRFVPKGLYQSFGTATERTPSPFCS